MTFLFLEGEESVGIDHAGITTIHMFLCVCMCVRVFISLERELTPRGHDIFHNTLVSSVFLWISFLFTLWLIIALQAWSGLCGSICKRLLPLDAPFCSLVFASRTVAQGPCGKLGKISQSWGTLIHGHRSQRPLPLHCWVPIIFIVAIISPLTKLLLCVKQLTWIFSNPHRSCTR